MSEDGYIITNSHVIEGCGAVDVVLQDERVFQALLVGQDAQSDLAVLKIDCAGLTPPSSVTPPFWRWGTRWRPSAIRWGRSCGAP